MRPLAVLVALAFLLPPSQALPGDEELYGYAAGSAGWHAVEVALQAPGSLGATLDINPREARSSGGGLWLLDVDGAVLRASVDATTPRQLTQVSAMVSGARVLDLAFADSPPDAPIGWDAVLGAGRYVVVAVFAGDRAIAAEVRLTSDAPAVIGATRSGGEATLLRDHELDAVVNGLVSMPTPAGAVQARVVSQGSTALVAEQRLFGAFHGSSASLLLDMALVTPAGVESGARHYAFDNLGPGAYQFLLRSMVDVAGACDVADCEAPGAWVLHADVALPS